MKFSIPALCFAAGSAIVNAHPLLQSRANNGTKASNSASNAQACQNQKPPSGTAGAAYFITNQPDGNFIVASHVGQDGKLTFRDAIWAGGRGSHGLNNLSSPDPLFSQGSIKVSGKSVFTINAGSNTATMFAIDPSDPAKLKMVGQPVSTGGEFPMSLTISKQSGQVCVLNGGTVNGVNCFKQDSKLGLVQMDNTQRPLNLNQTTPPTGPENTASHLIFSEDGKQLLASAKGTPPKPGFIAIWEVDATTGALSPTFSTVPPPKGGLLPFSMTVIPGKNALLVTDPGVGADIVDLSPGGNKSSTLPIEGQKAACWSAFSTKTGNFYLTDIGTGVVTEVKVDNQLKPTIVKQYPQGAESSTIDNDIATINNKDFLYVMAPGSQSVKVLSLDGPGNAKPLQTFNFANAAKTAGVKTSTANLQGMTVFIGK